MKPPYYDRIDRELIKQGGFLFSEQARAFMAAARVRKMIFRTLLKLFKHFQ